MNCEKSSLTHGSLALCDMHNFIHKQAKSSEQTSHMESNSYSKIM